MPRPPAHRASNAWREIVPLPTYDVWVPLTQLREAFVGQLTHRIHVGNESKGSRPTMSSYPPRTPERSSNPWSRSGAAADSTMPSLPTGGGRVKRFGPHVAGSSIRCMNIRRRVLCLAQLSDTRMLAPTSVNKR
jgi:hypothetical protein